MFEDKPIEWITAGTDGCLELLDVNPDFAISDEDFPVFVEWYLRFRKRELWEIRTISVYMSKQLL